MNVERETLVKFGVPITATLVFTALVLVLGSMYRTSPAGKAGVDLSETGAFALVGLMVVFIIGLGVLGGLVSRRQRDDD